MISQNDASFFISQVVGIGPRKSKYIFDTFCEPDAIFKASEASFRKVKKLTKNDIDSIISSRKKWDGKAEREKLIEKNVRFISQSDEEYPVYLRQIFDPPIGIYVKGKVPDRNKISIAVVGSRNCSYYGRDMAKAFSRKLSEEGVQIISGMAKGIDGYAHEGALIGGTPTFAVLGNGVDICYPMGNYRIYENLIEKGGLISEYPIGTKANPAYFPMRNRMISGIAKGVFIVEANKKSGSLITANMGLEQNRDIFALPGRISDMGSKGCNNLIKAGANLVESPEDILDFYQIPREKTEIKSYSIENNLKNLEKNDFLLETIEKIVYANLRCEPKHLEQIVSETKISSANAITTLISLECKGLCQQVMQNYYIRSVV